MSFGKYYMIQTYKINNKIFLKQRFENLMNREYYSKAFFNFYWLLYYYNFKNILLVCSKCVDTPVCAQSI